MTDSVSILATLLDSSLDVLASLINLIAVRHALEPADNEHRFGHGKAEALSGIGQALLSALDINGQPTPLVQCMLRPPQSRMGVISNSELAKIVNSSNLVAKYATIQDKKTAKELLQKKMQSHPDKFKQKINILHLTYQHLKYFLKILYFVK